MARMAHSRNSNAIRQAGVAALPCGVLALAVSACAPATTEAPPQQPAPAASPQTQGTVLGAPPRAETADATAGAGVRVLSWNVSRDAFVKEPAALRALAHKAQADILLLDEVSPSTNESQIRNALAGLKSECKDDWYIDFGKSGGRQRGVIVSRMPLERLPEFADVVPYPEAERRRIHERMAAANQLRPAYSMDGGIPVNGVVVLAGERRLLAVTIDLQCCRGDAGRWQEYRRRVEAREVPALTTYGPNFSNM